MTPRFHKWAVALPALCVALSGAAGTAGKGCPALDVGWHDEFNTLDGWSPWTAFGGFDILRGDVGKLEVVLGKTSMYMPGFKDYRAGVYQDFDVDVNRYPVLAVRVLRIHHAATWDVQLFQYRDRNAP